jgi:hypothetical protein
MRLRIVTPNKITVGCEDLNVAFDVTNSRVGNGALSIAMLIYRWVCGNGCIFGGGKGKFFSRRHIGNIKPEEFRKEFTSSLESIPEFIDFAAGSVEKANMTVLSERDVKDFIRNFKEAGLKTVANVLTNEIEGKNAVNAWEVVNIATYKAQEYALDTRIKIETIAGKLLTDLSKVS